MYGGHAPRWIRLYPHDEVRSLGGQGWITQTTPSFLATMSTLRQNETRQIADSLESVERYLSVLYIVPNNSQRALR